MRALGKAKRSSQSALRYTPLDPKIRAMMLKAGLGVDISNPERSALPGMGSLRPSRGLAGKGPLEMFGPKPDRVGAAAGREKLQRAVQQNKLQRDLKYNRPGIPTGLSAQAAAKRGNPFRYSPPPLSKRDQSLARALGKRPRRGD